GALRDSLTFEIGPDGAALFGAQHGLYVIAGVGAHPIAVRQARALRFYWEKRGVVFIGPSVNHPGAPVNDFRLRALSLAFGDGTLERAVSQFWQSMFQAGGL
ncbi:MAG TPA: hypothetical protein VNM16_00225, partial [Bacillota bacterium]|nr:hypothetical protein [Bacillota bacterium]